jgi:hypothetical protein
MPKIKLIKKGKPLADAYGVDVYKQVGPGGKYQAYDAVGGKLMAEAEGISDLAHKLASLNQDAGHGMAKMHQAMDELSQQFKKMNPGDHTVFMADQHMPSKKPSTSDDEAYAAYLQHKKQMKKEQAEYYLKHYKQPPNFDELLGTMTGSFKKPPGKTPEKIKQEKELEKAQLQQIIDSAQPKKPLSDGISFDYTPLEAKLMNSSVNSGVYTNSSYSSGMWAYDSYGNAYPSNDPYQAPPPPPWSPAVQNDSVYSPASDTSLTSCIFHQATPADSTFTLCWNPKAQPLKNWPHPEHGTWVWCTSCAKAGIQPDPGFALEFAPEGSHLDEKGNVVFHVGKEKAA